eukprot:288484_1
MAIWTLFLVTAIYLILSDSRQFYRLQNKQSGKCIYHNRGSRLSYTSCNANSNQRWYSYDAGSYTRLMNAFTGNCIVNRQSGTDYVTSPDGWTFDNYDSCLSSPNDDQYWRRIAVGASYFRLQNFKTQLCMYQNSDGRFGIYRCEKNSEYLADQHWIALNDPTPKPTRTQTRNPTSRPSASPTFLPTQSPSPGHVYRLQNKESGDCIYHKTGSPLSYKSCDLNDNQKWYSYGRKWSYTQLRNVNTGNCIVNRQSGTNYVTSPDGWTFDNYACSISLDDENDDQFWRRIAMGSVYFQLQNLKTQLCMYQNSDGRFGIHPCDSGYTADQHWRELNDLEPSRTQTSNPTLRPSSSPTFPPTHLYHLVHNNATRRFSRDFYPWNDNYDILDIPMPFMTATQTTAFMVRLKNINIITGPVHRFVDESLKLTMHEITAEAYLISEEVGSETAMGTFGGLLSAVNEIEYSFYVVGSIGKLVEDRLLAGHAFYSKSKSTLRPTIAPFGQYHPSTSPTQASECYRGSNEPDCPVNNERRRLPAQSTCCVYKFLTWNALSLNDVSRWSVLQQEMIYNKVDVVFIQEAGSRIPCSPPPLRFKDLFVSSFPIRQKNHTIDIDGKLVTYGISNTGVIRIKDDSYSRYSSVRYEKYVVHHFQQTGLFEGDTSNSYQRHLLCMVNRKHVTFAHLTEDDYFPLIPPPIPFSGIRPFVGCPKNNITVGGLSVKFWTV